MPQQLLREWREALRDDELGRAMSTARELLFILEADPVRRHGFGTFFRWCVDRRLITLAQLAPRQ